MTREFGRPMGQPSPDILDGAERSESRAAKIDLGSATMVGYFKEFRKLVDEGEYSMHVDPDTGSLTIKDENSQVIFMHEDGIRFEASYQDWLKAQRERAEKERAAAASKKVAGKQI